MCSRIDAWNYNRCFLVDDAGYVITHESFVYLQSPATPKVEGIHITTLVRVSFTVNLISIQVFFYSNALAAIAQLLQEPYIADHLIRNDYMILKRCYDPEKSVETRYYLVHTCFSNPK